MFVTARIYDDDQPQGYRVLVDRMWPRGVSKEDAAVDEWPKDIAPSNDLRQWFHDAGSDAFDEFAASYRAELDSHADEVEHLRSLDDQHSVVVLLYGSRDSTHNNAVVLADVLNGT